MEKEGAHNCCQNHDHIANTEMVLATARRIAERDAGILELLRLAEEREKNNG